MTKTLQSIEPLQLGKILAAVYGLLALIFVPFFVLFAVIGSLAPRSSEATPGVIAGVVGVLVMSVVFPVMYAVMGFIIGVIGAWVYNLVAKWFGGLRFEVE